jgi:LPXTG-motif cell wall-anchored protein
MTIDLHLAALVGLIVFCIVGILWWLLRRRRKRRPPPQQVPK